MAAKRQTDLQISEGWIRERINLHTECLSDVRSLTLPGSYHEKITHLGRSLLGFTRLKQLDLSRNALHTLEGLEHLTSLETLNLYYNNVPNLKEVFRLRHNVNLRELDLRLNPVTKDEPDYRLFVIHMLVNLRKLDDRPVKESERKAALMHFDTDQAYEMVQDVQPPPPQLDGKEEMQNMDGMTLPYHVKSRKDLVQSLAPRPSDGTTKLLELLREKDKGLWEKEARKDDREHSGSPVLRKTGVGTRSLKGLIGSPLRASSEVDYSEEVHKPGPKPTFTPHPQSPSPSHSHPRSSSGVPSSQKKPFYHLSPGHSSQEGPKSTVAAQAAEDLLKVVERYTLLSAEEKGELHRQLALWFAHNAPTSDGNLHGQVNLGEIHRLQKMVDTRESELAMKNNLLLRQEEEMAEMKGQLEQLSLQVQRKEYEARSNESRRSQLEQAERDLVTVQRHVHKLQTENSHLLLKLQNQPSQDGIQELQEEIGRARQENARLHSELQRTTQQHEKEGETMDQLRQLVTMLQESHQSLVSTNSHLLQEIQESKQHHARDVQQMHMNYEHLRKTVDIVHSI